ncbi:MAG: CDP-alcohol phosphatidyltransferase family protein [Candidatus Riflebacteria bacterium]|nr:CDP-alcohol phosphatidyltransferase family protein [Candidatus Riflebacteria bacterium]
METYSIIRSQQYTHHSNYFPYILDWKCNPYTFLKSIFYMESSAVLVYFLQETKIHPNFITFLYCACGVIGGLLLSLPNCTANIFATAIFFSKGILDWTDGHYARLTKQTSTTGHILDTYGALLNDLGLRIGLGFFVFNKTGEIYILYILPLLVLFFAINLTSFSQAELFVKTKCEFTQDTSITNKNYFFEEKNELDNYSLRFYSMKNLYLNLTAILDERARSVDFVCLCILIDLSWGYSFSTYIFLLMVIRQLSILIASYYIFYRYSLNEQRLACELKATNVFP